jgi:mannose-6-phosphate isomerase-like protein (cupin superfamily)
MLVRRQSLNPIDFSGLKIFDYTAGSEVSSSFAIIEVPAGVSHAEALSRRSDKYYFVTRGEIRFALEGEEFPLVEGDFCLVEQGKRFRYRNQGPAPATLVLVHTPSFELDAGVFADALPLRPA